MHELTEDSEFPGNETSCHDGRGNVACVGSDGQYRGVTPILFQAARNGVRHCVVVAKFRP